MSLKRLAFLAMILESDVHLSKDGVPVLLHDPSLDRTTNGRGLAAELTWEAIAGFEAHWCLPEDAPEGALRPAQITGRVPSLEEAFEAFPAARFNLELKSEDPRTIERTLELLVEYDRADRTLLAAGDDLIMQALRRALDVQPVSPAIGASVSEIVAAVGAAVNGTPMPAGVMALQVPASFMGEALVTEPFVREAHAQGIAVHVWTINERAQTEALLALGVDGIVTDYPGQIARWLRE